MDKKLKFTFDMVPPSWPLSFVQDCPMATACISHLAGEHVPANVSFGPAVYPTALHDGRCVHFKQIRIMRGAWGMNELFRQLTRADSATLHRRVKAYLGGNGTYYRYNRGERVLTPNQQENILAMFKNFGYTKCLEFDHYQDVYDFS